ncbi:MAG: hypothetical protein SFW66_09865 [Gammaproteobacteria bacterium]|nr:hypothetical protein [Gammaproteobacteria bacterium]
MLLCSSVAAHAVGMCPVLNPSIKSADKSVLPCTLPYVSPDWTAGSGIGADLGNGTISGSIQIKRTDVNERFTFTNLGTTQQTIIAQYLTNCDNRKSRPNEVQKLITLAPNSSQSQTFVSNCTYEQVVTLWPEMSTAEYWYGDFMDSINFNVQTLDLSSVPRAQMGAYARSIKVLISSN